LELHYGCAETEAELVALRGSKYLQASVGFAYRSVKAALEKGREVLFSGTPCQVAGLYGFLGNVEYPRLLTIDIVCHGVPSPKVFRKYLRERESLEHGRIRQIDFRTSVLDGKS
jgi:coenzyme F420-reducing hydrogenase beta subunit